MRVCLFRHGPAVAHGTAGVAEDARPLTPEGRRKTMRAARGVRALKLGIDAVFSSRLPRALETARILTEVLGLPDPKTADELLPEGTPDQLLELLRKAKSKVPAVVGHEPGLTTAIAHLVGGKEEGSFLLKKAGFAVVELESFAPRPKGILRLLLTPSVLRDLAR